VPELAGIARMAAESELLEAKRLVTYRELEARSYLSRDNSGRMPFRWMINPYRGCEFGCKYCYARYTHEFMELRDGEQFETEIFAKKFNRAVFAREVARLPAGETIAIGTATDPYQPAERRFGVTRSMLEVFSRTAGLQIGIITKSDLVARDLDLFVEIARRHRFSIAMTVTTMDPALARLLEPRAPRPDLRLNAVRRLSDAGIAVRISCAPVLPLINDSEASLDAVARAASDAGACGIWANVLFLKPCAYAVFLPFLERQFPHLVRRYKERFARQAYLRGAYPVMIRERLDSLRKRYCFDQKGEARLPELWPENSQLELFEEDPVVFSEK
jgi:DNA repair photolyase